MSTEHDKPGLATLPHPAVADAPGFSEAPGSMQYLVGELFEHPEDGPMVNWFWFDLEPVFSPTHGWMCEDERVVCIAAELTPAPAGYGDSATDENAYESYVTCIMKRPEVLAVVAGADERGPR